MNNVNLYGAEAITQQTNVNKTGTGYVEVEEGLFTGTTNATNTSTVDADMYREKLGVLTSIGEEIGLDLTGNVETDLDALNAYPEKLDAMIAQIDKIIEEKTRELENLQKQQQQLKSDESEMQIKLDDLNKKMQTNQAEQLKASNELVKKQQENLATQAAYHAQYSQAYADAEAKYNPETDGDKQAFIEKQMASFSGPQTQNLSSLQSNLSSLQATGDMLSSSISTINTSLLSVQDKIKTVNNKISIVQTALDIAVDDKVAVEKEKAEIPAKALETIKNAVGPKEWKLVEENNINLSETLEDGSPRYVLAKGEDDGKWHLYDYGTDTKGWAKSKGTVHPSIARLYGEYTYATIKNPITGKKTNTAIKSKHKGLDITSNGNGYMHNIKEAEPGAKNTSNVYGINLSATSFKANKTAVQYKTDSPLTFDMDENGINTSDELIQYDIDGNGTLDNINNVHEGVLAFDLDGDGIAGENGKELFGNNTDLDGDGKADGYKDGFEALKALARKENLIDGDADISLDENDLNFLSEKYGLTMKMGYDGETKSLNSLNLTEINLAKTNETTLQDNFDGKGNQLMTQEGATFVQNGKTKNYADIWQAKK